MLTTPLYQNREFILGEPDEEFKQWSSEGNTITLWLRETNGKLVLKWDGKKFIGSDPRGGFSTLSVPPTKSEKFAKELKNNTKLNYTKKKEVIKTSEVAIISDIEQEFGDTYPSSQNQKILVDKLFSTGYNRVYVLDFKAPKNYDKLCDNVLDTVNCHFLLAEGTKDSEDSLELHPINKLNNFVMPVSTWLRIKGQVTKSQKTLVPACQDQIKEKNLKAFAFSKSRRTKNTPNDSRLKNFKVSDA